LAQQSARRSINGRVLRRLRSDGPEAQDGKTEKQPADQGHSEEFRPDHFDARTAIYSPEWFRPGMAWGSYFLLSCSPRTTPATVRLPTRQTLGDGDARTLSVADDRAKKSFRSKPHLFLAAMAFAVIAVAMALPLLPVVGRWLGFVAPPPLIRQMSTENLLWGAPRIHGELLKLGFSVAQSSVAKYMVKRRGPPSQEWWTFLRNHAPHIAAMDLFVVPTIGFKLLYGFVIIRLDRRDLVWIRVTTNPTAEWVARQITEAFPWDGAPRYMIRDRDRIYGTVVTRRLRAMGIRDKPIAPASPWQNSFAERLIGSIRRECLDHIIVLGEQHLRRILKTYADYYNGVRTHRSLNKDAPVSRQVRRSGVINSRAILGGLHRQYVRI
jgi:transposase InsO family protein